MGGCIYKISKSDQDDFSISDKRLFLSVIKRPTLYRLPEPSFDQEQSDHFACIRSRNKGVQPKPTFKDMGLVKENDYKGVGIMCN